MNVCDACRDLGIPRLIYVSSIHAFKDPQEAPLFLRPKTSTQSMWGATTNAKSKAEATRYVLKCATEGLNAVIVHPTGVIGPYEYKLSNMGQLFVDFMRSRLYAIIDGAYDFVDVRDVAKGIALAAKFGRKGENYILSGEQISVKSMMEVLSGETGIKAPTRIIPCWLAQFTGFFAEIYYKARKQQPLFTSYSVSTLSSNSMTSSGKALKEFGYKSRPLRETMKDTVTWLKEHTIKK